jgi:glycyl-tRNA synthetase beta chain
MSSFLLEVGTEELPADFVESAISQWESRLPTSLNENLLIPEAIAVYGTPRRLAVLIQGLPNQQPDREEEIKGPPAKAAFKDGNPTKAAEGFARKQEVAIEDLEIRDTPKGEFVFIQKQIVGQPLEEILPGLVKEWITGLEGRRFMHWGDGDFKFPRPIRWLVALVDDQVLPVELVSGSDHIESDRVSRGHRVLHPDPVTINHATEYIQTLRSAFVEVDPSSRNYTITQQIQTHAQEINGTAEIYPDLLAEVTNLVEWSTAVVGRFDAEFLVLPPEVITTVMVTHQRYFPVKAQDGELLPNFIAIANGDPDKSNIIAAGNERVIRARLADAQFFYKADCDEPLDTYLPQLETVTFQEDLGTMRDKVDRIVDISQRLADQLELGETEQQDIESAALLCKADLVTQMVYEFPELQGIMGQKYALVSGESEAVANGIFEHYLPRSADDALPESIIGQVVGIADRLDTLVGIFGLGMLPTGSSDPFALRRAANSIIHIIWNAELELNLYQILQELSEEFVTAHPDEESPFNNLVDFFIQRVQTLLQEDLNIDYDLVNAVLGENDPEYTQRVLEDLLDGRDRAIFLQTIRVNGKLDEIYETVNRSSRLAAKGTLDKSVLDPNLVVDPNLFEQNSEEKFFQAIQQLLPKTLSAQAERNYQALVDALAEIAPTVSEFFDGEDSVMVMADNKIIQMNRLNLLGLLRNHARVLADFAPIVKS